MKSRSYSSSNSSEQQIPTVHRGSTGNSQTSPVNINNNVPAAAPLNCSDDDHDGHCYPDEKFEQFINRVRNETRRGGTTTTDTNTNRNKSMNKSVVTGSLPLSSGWRSVPNNSNNNARSGQSPIFGKPMSGDNAMNFLLKQAAIKSTGKIIDSREVSKRYGKIMPPMTTMDEVQEAARELYYQGAVITSNEALKKYNGAFIP